jgi:hypothetical protein
MSNLETVVLKWKMYTSYQEVYNDKYAWSEGKESDTQGKGVYLMTDSKRVPLYVGMVYGKWGFADRYNATGFLDAAIVTAGNLIFFAEVKSKSLAEEVETMLIWQEKPSFNKNKMAAQPQRTIIIEHEGQVPNFKFSTVPNKLG